MPPKRNQLLSLYGRVGAYVQHERHDPRITSQIARDTFAASFLTGHGCTLCPTVDLDTNLPDGERQRRADMLRRGHYARMAVARAQKKAVTSRSGDGLAEGHGHVRSAG